MSGAGFFIVLYGICGEEIESRFIGGGQGLDGKENLQVNDLERKVRIKRVCQIRIF